MVRLRFEGRKLEDLYFWTKSDPYLSLSRPAKNGPGVFQVCKISGFTLTKMIEIFNMKYCNQ